MAKTIKTSTTDATNSTTSDTALSQPTTPSPTRQWADRLALALDVLALPGQYVGPPPGREGEDAGESLRLLIDLRQRLRVDDSFQRPADEVGERHAQNWASASRKDALAEMVRDAVHAIDFRIAECLALGAIDKRVVHSKDFRELRYLTIPTHGPVTELVLAFGMIDSLAEGHAMRSVLPPADFYQFSLSDSPDPEEVGRPAIVLGQISKYVVGGGGTAKPFYALEGALRWTANLRRQQRERLAELAFHRRHEERQRHLTWWNSPAGIATQEYLLAKKLVEEGKTPPVPEYFPAVRGHGPRD